MMEAVRVRLMFEDRYILSKSQKTAGLKRSWTLLKPHHHTISDFSSYLLRIFHLQDACPNGLLLSMDGFVLPPFESTSILKDKDIVCVKKKKGTFSEIIKVGDEVNSLEEVEIVEKQPVLTRVELLANEEFEKETGDYESEPEEDEREGSKDGLQVEDTADGTTVSKKRKASKKLQSSKRKKNKSASSEECPVHENSENGVCEENNGSSCRHSAPLQRSFSEKDTSSDGRGELEKSSTPEIDEISNNMNKSLPNAKRFCQLQENDKGRVDASCTPGGAKKFPSRSARRKKAKRRWLREQVQIEKEELHQKLAPENDNWQSPDKGTHNFFQNSDVEDVVVPVVVRPGHIRFEPLGEIDADPAVKQNKSLMETFQWNGITNKKKGQKWGKENNASSKRNGCKNFSQEYSEMLTIEEEAPIYDPMDFDKLTPYASLPKEGDVVAYRLIELSSSWTPELSSFRVGKISCYNPESNRIMLLPVPEYPVAFEKKIDDEATAIQPDTSPYGEDGSLEVDFLSLVDVRIVKDGSSNFSKSVTGGVNEGHVGDQDAVTSLRPNNEEAHTPIRENGKLNAWEEISQALSEKKAQLSQEDDWSAKASSGKSPWSYKALRSSALGPTMAFLRAQNELG